MWFKFDREYPFKPDARKGQATVIYKPGVYNVTRECAAKAEAAGAGKPTKAVKADGEAAD